MSPCITRNVLASSSGPLATQPALGYFIVAVIALGLPGPDPVTTALELLPMWALFEGSIWLAVLVERARGNALEGDRLNVAQQRRRVSLD